MTGMAIWMVIRDDVVVDSRQDLCLYRIPFEHDLYKMRRSSDYKPSPKLWRNRT